MEYDEVFELLNLCYSADVAHEILYNTLEIQNKIQDYPLEKLQSIQEVDVIDYPKSLSHFGIHNDLLQQPKLT